MLREINVAAFWLRGRVGLCMQIQDMQPKRPAAFLSPAPSSEGVNFLEEVYNSLVPLGGRQIQTNLGGC